MNKNRKINNKSKRNNKNLSDQVNLRGQIELPIATGGSGNGILLGGSSSYNLSPTTLGGRPAVMAGIFLRYRIKDLNYHYVPTVGSNTAGSLAIGVSDDTSVSSGTVLTDYFATVQLRTVNESQVWNKMNKVWMPVDRKKWYYCDSESSNSDDRFLFPGALVANGLGLTASTTYGTLVIRYSIVFEGAIPNVST